MQCEYIKITDFIYKTDKFIIPLYQRNYEWKDDQCEALYYDLIELKDNKRTKHFIGSIVSITTKNLANKRELIDGQQRIITIYLIFLAMYNLIKEGVISKEITEELIKEKYLIDKFSKESNKEKIEPTKKDKDDLYLIIDGKIDLNQKYKSNIIENYKFFYYKLKNKKVSIDDLYKSIQKLEFVSMVLDVDENPQLIFESLNSKGLALQISDKIRNFLLMQIADIEEQKNIYEKYWKKIEDILGDSFDLFIKHYLIFKNKFYNTNNGKKRDGYEAYKRFFFSSIFGGYLSALKDMMYYAELYGCLLHFYTNSDKINKYLKYFYFLSQNDIRPFLLFILDMYKQKEIPEKNIISIFNILDSYLFRRAICKKGISWYLFANIQKEMLKNEKKDYFLTFKESFFKQISSKIDYKFPNDNEFEESFKKGEMQLNLNTDRKKRQCFYMIARLENFNNKEYIDFFENKKQYQIEHIMPQKLSPEWIKDLGDNYKKIHENWLNNIGNLTLTGYNPELSNKSFSLKRKLYAESSLKLNQIIAQYEKFGESEMYQRVDFLSKRAIQIWSYPKEEITKYQDELTFTRSNEV